MNRKVIINLKTNVDSVFVTTMGKSVFHAWGIDAVGYFKGTLEEKDTNMMFPWTSVDSIEKPIS